MVLDEDRRSREQSGEQVAVFPGEQERAEAEHRRCDVPEIRCSEGRDQRAQPKGDERRTAASGREPFSYAADEKRAEQKRKPARKHADRP